MAVEFEEGEGTLPLEKRVIDKAPTPFLVGLLIKGGIVKTEKAGTLVLAGISLFFLALSVILFVVASVQHTNSVLDRSSSVGKYIYETTPDNSQ